MRCSRSFLLALLLVTVGMVPLRAANEPFDLYAILPVTGPAAFLGSGEKISVQAFEGYINATGGIQGHPLHMIVEDDQSNPAVSVQLVNQIIAKHAPAFIGPGFSQTCAAVLPLIVTTGPVGFCLSSGLHPPQGSYAFVAGLSALDLQANTFRYFKAKGLHTIALLVTTDASGQDGENNATALLKLPEFSDLRIVATEHMGSTDLAVTAQMARINASGAEVLDAWVSGTPLGTVLHGIHESGYNGVVMTSTANAIKQQMEQYNGFIPRELLLPTLGFQMIGVGPTPAGETAAKKIFIDVLQKNGVPDPGTANMIVWDPMTIIVSGLRKLGPSATAEQLRSYMLGIKGFAGTNGLYDFTRGDRTRGVDPKSSGVMRWDPTKSDFVMVSRAGGVPL